MHLASFSYHDSRPPALWSIAAFFLGFMASLHAGCSPSVDSQLDLIGGTKPEALGPVERSLVQVLTGSERYCSGVLVSLRLVLTAAHCLPDNNNEELLVRFEGSDTIAASEFEAFDPRYRSTFPQFDIAWLRLERDAPETFEAVSLLADPSVLTQGKELILAGFAFHPDACHDDRCEQSRRQAKTRLEGYFDRPHLQSTLLVRSDPSPEGGQSCGGDSGGPSFVWWADRWWLVGITNGKHPMITPEAYRDGQVDCNSDWTIQTFVGDYQPWIESSSGERLEAHQTDHIPLVQKPAALPPSGLPSWLEWFEFSDHRSAAWMSVQKLIEHMHLEARRQTPSDHWLAWLLEAGPSQTWVEAMVALESTVIGLPGQQVPIEELRPLASFPKLRRLQLRDQVYQGIEILPDLSQLQELSIEATFIARPPMTGLGLERLASPSLKAMRLVGLAQRDVQAISWKAFPSLRRLDLENSFVGWPSSKLGFIADLQLEELRITGLLCDQPEWSPDPRGLLKSLELRPFGRRRALQSCAELGLSSL